MIQVPQGEGKAVLEIANHCQGVNLVSFEATNSEQALDVVFVHVSNRKVEAVMEKLQRLPNVHITLFPTGVMALRPPANETVQQSTNIEERSPIEIFLSGLQSVGSWYSFLGYAALAGVVVWIGLFTNTIFLLVAAMLIAPFASPAMNLAIATARGDIQLIWRSIARYFVALTVTILVAALLSLILRQQIATPLMIDQSQVSIIAVLIPLAAGAAGALTLVQSERSSLVTGAATGMLVAASLAPPAGIIGMAGAIGRWGMVTDGLFLLFLQLCGINLSAAVLFRIFGLNTEGSRYSRGKRTVFPVTLFVTGIALVGLLTWQFSTAPHLQRSSLAQRANAEVQQIVDQARLGDLVESDVRFTRSDIPGQNTLLCILYVQRSPEVKESAEEIRDRLTQLVQTRLLNQNFDLTPLISVIVLEPPAIKNR